MNRVKRFALAPTNSKITHYHPFQSAALFTLHSSHMLSITAKEKSLEATMPTFMHWRKTRHLCCSPGTFYAAIPDIKNIQSTITMRKKRRERKHKPRPERLSVGKKKSRRGERLLRWRADALTEWTPVCAASVSALHQRHAAS